MQLIEVLAYFLLVSENNLDTVEIMSTILYSAFLLVNSYHVSTICHLLVSKHFLITSNALSSEF